MIIGKYKCLKCGYQFEELQMSHHTSLVKCPKCSGDQLKKCVSLSSFQLKGSGWYATDYNKPVKENATKAE